MVQKLEQGGKLADEAASIGAKVDTAAGFKREDSPPGVPSGLVAAAFRTAKDGAGQTPGSDGTEWIVFRVTDVMVPPVDLNSEDMKKLKEQLVRALSDEQLALYVAKLEKDIGTSINEAAFAQVTGASSNSQ
jgi:peptidyl-prolyl cis-trans isomerase D